MEYGTGSGPIFLDGLDCTGNEETLTQCNPQPNQVFKCTHKHDVGVFCQSKNIRESNKWIASFFSCSKVLTGTDYFV